MKTLKKLPKLFLSITFLTLVQLGMANTNGTEGKKSQEKAQEQQQEGKQKSTEKLDAEPQVKENAIEPKEVVKDSATDDSVSKYNFIFYFLYKFKYDQQEAL